MSLSGEVGSSVTIFHPITQIKINDTHTHLIRFSVWRGKGIVTSGNHPELSKTPWAFSRFLLTDIMSLWISVPALCDRISVVSVVESWTRRHKYYVLNLHFSSLWQWECGKELSLLRCWYLYVRILSVRGRRTVRIRLNIALATFVPSHKTIFKHFFFLF